MTSKPEISVVLELDSSTRWGEVVAVVDTLLPYCQEYWFEDVKAVSWW